MMKKHFLTSIVLLGLPLAAAGQEAEAPAEPSINDLVREGRYDEAADRLAAVISPETEEDAGRLAFFGEVLVAAGRMEQAVPVLERALELDDERPRLNFQLATALGRLGRTDDALDAYAEELAISEDDSVRYMAHANRAVLLSGSDRFVQAAGEWEAALAIRPYSGDLYGELARCYLGAERPKEALAGLERGEEHGFRSAQLYFNAGAGLYNLKAYTEAERAFRRAVEIDPAMAAGHRGLGSSLIQLERHQEAVGPLERYLELEPEAADAGRIQQEIKTILSESGS